MRNARDIPAASADSSCGGVVLLHGIAMGSWTLKKLERALQRRGFATLNLDYASRKKPLEQLAEDIHAPVQAFANQIDGPLHFVGHSMGGLLARTYVARHRPERLGRVVMLGTPNGGSEIADVLEKRAIYRWFFGPAGLQLTTHPDQSLAQLPPLDYPVGVVAGNLSIYPSSLFLLPRPNDGRVSVASAKLPDMADHIVIRSTHPWLTRHRRAIDQTIAFLHRGHFDPPRPRATARTH